ncbi:23S rRNA (pseudouridine(1915)-N(3))-methyltransferase RlmH [Orrella sp. JC864]|uniref:23S rRNA (pseudouridine(1915)-N(3))-methyltransferase RlmH n=1 Tax=Orrella sp. JC864 TaxID=3120298 RepID=UPI0012BBE44C
MKLIVAAVGTRMPAWVQAAWDDYAKRLPADCALELREIKPEPRTSGKSAAQMMAAEARRLQAALPAGVLRVALDERGQDQTTAQLSRRLEGWRAGGRDVALLVGGPDGLDAGLKAACDERLRLSSLTLPHPLVRVLLAEQLYRAWAVMTHHPYHRA